MTLFKLIGIKIFFLFLIVSSIVSHAKEARVEKVKLYENIYGDIYYNETFLINEKDAPVQISSVNVIHIPGTTSDLADQVWRSLSKYLSATEKKLVNKYRDEGIEVTIDAKGKDVVAVKFGIVAYDAFNEYLGGLTAITMDPPTDDMRWNFKPIYLFKFKKYGVVGVYVRQVRLSNGQIWNFNEACVRKKLLKMK